MAPVSRLCRRTTRLAPLGTWLHGTNPDYRGVYVFTNDLPVFSPEAPETEPADDVYRTRPCGTAEVVCYHDDPTRSMAGSHGRRDGSHRRDLARAARGALQVCDGVAHVLIFENRGAVVGTSNPHPHCQIYAGSMVYATMAREAEVGRAPPPERDANSWPTSSSGRRTGPGVISEGDHFFACVPWFAEYAYEVLHPAEAAGDVPPGLR